MQDVLRTHDLSQIIQQLPVAVVGVDGAGIIWFWNTQAETLLGYSSHEMNGSLFSTIAYGKTILFPAIDSAGVYLRQQNDGVFYAHLRILNQYDVHGDYTGSAICISSVYEEQPMEFQLRATEARYKAIVEDQHELICRFTPHGYITFANNAFYNYFNIPRTQKIKSLFWDLFDSQSSEKIKTLIAGLNDKRRTGSLELQVTTSLFQTELSWQEWYGRLLIREFGLAEYQFIGRDTTDSRLAEQRRIELAVERERARILKEFLSDVSHDLRTPLTAMLLAFSTMEYYVMQLQQKAETNDKTVQHLVKQTQSAKNNTERLSMLLDSMFDMMDYDILETYLFAPAKLNTLVESVVSATIPLAREKNIDVACELDSQVGLLRLDVGTVSRAVQNLLDNAIKYSLPDSQVVVRTAITCDSVYVEVKDQGAGIAENDLPHIFDRFFRTDQAPSSSTGGSGLGLAICKKIVEAHHGALEVESVLGKGTTFRIVLPARTQE